MNHGKINLERWNTMVWLIIIVIAYAPIFYRINRKLNYLEDEVKRLTSQINQERDL